MCAVSWRENEATQPPCLNPTRDRIQRMLNVRVSLSAVEE